MPEGNGAPPTEWTGTEEEVWKLVLDNEGLLRRETRKFLPKSRLREFEDMYSDVVLARAHSIMRNYDRTKGARPATYLVKVCAWYAFEWVADRKYKRRPEKGAEQLDTARHLEDPVDETTKIWVSHILERLPTEYADVLRWLYIRGNTPREIAQHLGLPTRQVREMITAGLFLARMEAGEVE